MDYQIEYDNQVISTDKQGYLLDLNDWSEALIPTLAEIEQIVLSADHLEVILFVRKFYLEYHTSPAIRALIKAMLPEFGAEKANSRYLQRLFPKGPAKQATKLAGLPKPAKCL